MPGSKIVRLDNDVHTRLRAVKEGEGLDNLSQAAAWILDNPFVYANRYKRQERHNRGEKRLREPGRD